MTEKQSEFADGMWAVLELMGHRKLAGFVREVSVAGAGLLRIDVPNPRAGARIAGADGKVPEEPHWTASQFYSPSAVYCITPCTEELARQFAATCQPRPVTRYELAAPANGAERDW